MQRVLAVVLFIFGCGTSLSYAVTPLAPKAIDDEKYGETYTAVALLENDTYLLLQVLFTNAGMGSSNALCRGLVVPPGKDGVNDMVRMSKGDWAFDGETNTLTLKECILTSQEGRTRFQVKTEKLRILLDIGAGMKAVRPPRHRFTSKEGMFEAELMIPWAPVSAKIRGPGLKGLNGKGMAYMDHTRSNALMGAVARQWVRYRGFYGKKPVLFQARFPQGDAPPVGWFWAGESKAPQALEAGQIQYGNDGKSVTVNVSGKAGQVTLKTDKLIYSFRPVESYGVLGHLVKAFIGNPLLRTYFATWTNASGESVRGVLEDALSDE